MREDFPGVTLMRAAVKTMSRSADSPAQHALSLAAPVAQRDPRKRRAMDGATSSIACPPGSASGRDQSLDSPSHRI